MVLVVRLVQVDLVGLVEVVAERNKPVDKLLGRIVSSMKQDKLLVSLLKGRIPDN